uniref:TIL domain-containing protein n=1 Tax=Panagrolaimus superbus TaxID=310955 RepID=A0A914XYF8_9BILA
MTKLLFVCFTVICLTLFIIQNSDAFPAKNINADGLQPEDCRKDEDFLECGTCPKTCTDPNPKCDSKCKPPMCQCKEGTVRATDGQCIKPEECPPNTIN